MTKVPPDGNNHLHPFYVYRTMRLFIFSREAHLNRIRLLNQASAPKFDHLRRLTDDVGILQHAKYMVANRFHGYCSDDNARALIVATTGMKASEEKENLLDMACRYLSFLHHAFNEECKRFRNFMGYDRRWLETMGSEDSHGRVVWSLGATAAISENENLAAAAADLLDRSLPATLKFHSPRALAFTLIGISSCPKKFHKRAWPKNIFKTLANRLYDAHRSNASEDWPWIEDKTTYANAKICQALTAAGKELGRGDIIDAGLGSLEWLAKVQTDSEGRFAPIGNKGWLVRGGTRTRFDQQPIEAQCMVEASLEARKITGDKKWSVEAQRCFAWFLGENELNEPLYDETTGGCRDGLTPAGTNQNQGAESTLAWLLSLFAMRQELIESSHLKLTAVNEKA